MTTSNHLNEKMKEAQAEWKLQLDFTLRSWGHKTCELLSTQLVSVDDLMKLVEAAAIELRNKGHLIAD